VDFKQIIVGFWRRKMYADERWIHCHLKLYSSIQIKESDQQEFDNLKWQFTTDFRSQLSQNYSEIIVIFCCFKSWGAFFKILGTILFSVDNSFSHHNPVIRTVVYMHPFNMLCFLHAARDELHTNCTRSSYQMQMVFLTTLQHQHNVVCRTFYICYRHWLRVATVHAQSVTVHSSTSADSNTSRNEISVDASLTS